MMPWPQLSSSGQRMPNTKEAENDRAAVDALRKQNGDGWMAWAFCRSVPLVSSSRPAGVTAAAPPRVRLALAKPPE
jgi:hypothetical protein